MTMRQSRSIMLGILTFAATVLAYGVQGADEDRGVVKAEPALPNVLLLGDSISMGYTEPVRELLKGRANVYRAPGNCQDSATGVQNLQKWLGDRKWDAVHFNFGIWDIHPLRKASQEIVWPKDMDKDPETIVLRHTTAQYIENLTKILAVLESTGATLIWASTTPVTIWRDSLADIEKNNKAAAALMAKHGVMVNDLYAYVSPQVKLWQSDDKCHFNRQGNESLAQRVAQSISGLLRQNNGESQERRNRVGVPPNAGSQ